MRAPQKPGSPIAILIVQGESQLAVHGSQSHLRHAPFAKSSPIVLTSDMDASV